MFRKLKDKLKTWTKKVSEKTEEIEENVESLEEKIPEEKIEKTTEKIKQKKDSLKQEIKELEKQNKVLKDSLPKELKEKVEAIPKEKLETPEKEKYSKKIKFSEKEFEKHAEELEFLLLENNVALEAVDKIIIQLKEKLIEKEISKKDLEKEITNSLKEIIEEILIEPFDLLEKINENQKKPFVILFCGINGSGKTTTTAKIAYLLKQNNLSCVFAAADTFRSAAIEQIKKHGEKLDIEVISHEYNSDPAAVGFDAIKFAQKNKKDVVLIDTAGRIHTDKNLMNQIAKVSKVCNPDLKIFVGESITGNDSVEQVKAFNEAIEIDGIILTKADVDEKGGTAISLGEVTGKPILFLGIGQEYNKLEKFDKEKFIEKLDLNQ